MVRLKSIKLIKNNTIIYYRNTLGNYEEKE